MDKYFIEIKKLIEDDLSKKIGLIFKCNDTSNHYNKDKFLSFNLKYKGVDVFLSLNGDKKNKVEAYFSVGDYRDGNSFFSSKIGFNASKPLNAILKDILERLQVEKLREKAEVIYQSKKEREHFYSIEKAKFEIFKKYIPDLRESWGGFFCGNINGITVDLKNDFSELKINTSNTDLLMAFCAYLNNISKK